MATVSDVTKELQEERVGRGRPYSWQGKARQVSRAEPDSNPGVEVSEGRTNRS